VRRAVEAECGPVLYATAPEAGRNSMFAAVLDTENWPVFCKGVRTDDQQARAHRHEIRINQHLRETTAHAPRLLWTVGTDGWLLAGYAFAPGRHADLTPASPDIPAATDVLAGHALVHGDVHELNLLVTGGQASLVLTDTLDGHDRVTRGGHEIGVYDAPGERDRDATAMYASRTSPLSSPCRRVEGARGPGHGLAAQVRRGARSRPARTWPTISFFSPRCGTEIATL
jgi:hypothetical protein